MTDQLPRGLAGIPQATFSTAHVDPASRQEAWRSVLSVSHDVETRAADFAGEVRSLNFGKLVLHRMESDPHEVARSARRIRADGLEHIVLYSNLAPIEAETAQGQTTIAGGLVGLNDLARPSRRTASSERGSLVASLSRELVRDVLGTSDGLHGLVMQPGQSALMRSHFELIWAQADSLPQAVASDVAQSTAHLVAACLRPSLGRSPEVRAAQEEVRIHKAKRFIESNLGRLDLTPDLIARSVGLSRSALFRCFEPVGGVAAFVAERRLQGVYHEIENRRGAILIGEAGRKFGFASAAHLSRAFRKRFGASPRDCAAGRSASSPRPRGATGTPFQEWVAALG